jgi:hypothetical protein
MAIVPQSDQQDRITRELAALAALRAHRSNSDLPAQIAAESYQQNDRLRELAEQQRAAELQAADIAAGLRAWRGRVPNGSTRGQARRVARRGWRAARVIPLADAIPQIPLPPEAEPVELAPEQYRTSVEIAAALLRQGLARAALALDVWKAAIRRSGGRGEWLTGQQFTDLLIAAGLSKRTAQRAKREGLGLLWDTYEDQSDRRRVIWHVRSTSRICRALEIVHPGQWARLPAAAYTSADLYTVHASAAWIAAHDRSSREQQAAALGVTKHTVRARQRAAGLQQRARIDEYARPASEGQALELATRLQDAHGQTVPHWRGRRGSYRRQTTNYYFGGPARLIGKRRSRHIAAQNKGTSRYRGEVKRQNPRRFEDHNHLVDWQARNPDRGGYTYAGRLAPSGAQLWTYHYSLESGQ